MDSQDKPLRARSAPKLGSVRALFAADGDIGGPPVHQSANGNHDMPRDCLSSSNGVEEGAWEGEEIVSTPKRKATARRLFESCPVSEIERYLQAAEAKVRINFLVSVAGCGRNPWHPTHFRRTHSCVSESVITQMDRIARPLHIRVHFTDFHNCCAQCEGNLRYARRPSSPFNAERIWRWKL